MATRSTKRSTRRSSKSKGVKELASEFLDKALDKLETLAPSREKGPVAALGRLVGLKDDAPKAPKKRAKAVRKPAGKTRRTAERRPH
jgi:hypothetical protein